MEDNKVIGGRQGVQTMLFYYLSSLIGKVDDPKQYIATEIGSMIDLSEEQIQYIKMNIANENKLTENLSSSISLLKNMEETGKVDFESIKIVRGILEIMKTQSEQVIKEYMGDDDGEE